MAALLAALALVPSWMFIPTRSHAQPPTPGRHCTRLSRSLTGLPLRPHPSPHRCDAGIVDPYPPLCDVKGCYTAQVRSSGPAGWAASGHV